MLTPARGSRFIIFIFAVMAFTVFMRPAYAITIDLERPGEREFVRDQARMLDPATIAEIQKISDKLLTDKATPILVITIESMAACGVENIRIETFATLLFDQWGIGTPKLGGHTWNTGILLLVSKGDRKARIELGAGWGRRKDDHCQTIMNDHIIPHFKQGNFSQGILAGVQSLNRMARNLSLPPRPKPMGYYVLIIGFWAMLIFTAVSLGRKGASGWAWATWAVIFSIIGTVLYALTSGSGSSGGGYSGGGGSFGGGFSGGGGATGSW